MKNRSKEELNDNIDDEYTWRFQEIVNMKNEVRLMKPGHKNLSPLVRSLVMLSYSHWEGFVKYVSRYFFDYLTRLGLDESQTNPALVAASLNYSLKNKGVAEANNLICRVLTDVHYKPQYNGEAMSDPKSNLNFDVLEIISTNLGIDISKLSLKKKQLDEIILGRRNKMAHGEKDGIDATYGIEVADASLELMLEYKILLQNMIATDGFKRQIL